MKAAKPFISFHERQRKISGNSFAIGGGIPGVEVSWQVTGTRQDAYAVANPLTVEREKMPQRARLYIHPELYGAAEEEGIGWARHAPLLREMKGGCPEVR